MSDKTAKIPDIFDQWAAAVAPADAVSQPASSPTASPQAGPPASEDTPAMTPLPLKRALQELLKNGCVEETAKPQLFRQLVSAATRVDTLLEPLDLRMRLDELRGLAFVAVAEGYAAEGEDDDEWTHPLVRRQRLTLDQSLLLAILRREFLQREQESGLGAPVYTTLDTLLPQLEIYLGETGSDMQSRKRLVNLLENLRGHGVVSEIDGQERFAVRPMIVHLANPENLQALLQRLRELSAAPSEAGE